VGNWRIVQIVGSCAVEDVPALVKEIMWDSRRERQPFYCLSHTGGLAGLPMWVGEAINAVGNLAERNYGPEDVATDLENLAQVAPSLLVKVHCGGDWESQDCIATVVLENGIVAVEEPEIVRIPDPPEGQWRANLFEQLERQRKRCY
jgi:hypothetical protein